jgi:putative flippase GtrA
MHRRSVWLLLRFATAGLLNTAFGYAVFALLIVVGVGTVAALVAATVAGVVFNFQTSRHLVFRSGGRVARFVGVYGAVLALNVAGIHGLRALGLSDLQAQAVLALPVAGLSFVLQRLFVFPAPEPA